MVGQPVFQCFDALLAIDRNGVFPCGAAAEYAGEVDPGFGDELKRLGERLVAHAGREVDEGLLRHRGGFAEILLGLFTAIDRFPLARARPFDERHVHGDLNLHHVNAVLGFGEFLHALDYDLGLFAREVDALVVETFLVADEFQEEGNVHTGALAPDSLHPGVLGLVDCGRIERAVVKEDLDAVRSSGLEAHHRVIVQQVGQPAGLSIVISALLVGEQQAGVLGALLGRGQPVLRVQQDRAGMRGEDAHHGFFELCHHLAGHCLLINAFLLGDCALERAALVHRRRGDYAARVRDCLQASLFARGKLHHVPSKRFWAQMRTTRKYYHGGSGNRKSVSPLFTPARYHRTYRNKT